MAAPAVTGAVGPLQGQPPEGHAGRGQGSPAVPRQPQLEDVHRPGLVPRAAPRRVEARSARDLLARRPGRRHRARDRRGRLRRDHDQPQLDVLRASQAVRGPDPGRVDRARSTARACLGGRRKSARLNVTAPPSVAAGTYEFTITGTNQGRSASIVAQVTVGRDLPTALAPTSARGEDERRRSTPAPHAHRRSPGRQPATCRARSPATSSSRAATVAHGRRTVTYVRPRRRTVVRNLASTAPTSSAFGPSDAAGNWSTWADTTVPYSRHAHERSQPRRSLQQLVGAAQRRRRRRPTR